MRLLRWLLGEPPPPPTPSYMMDLDAIERTAEEARVRRKRLEDRIIALTSEVDIYRRRRDVDGQNQG